LDLFASHPVSAPVPFGLLLRHLPRYIATDAHADAVNQAHLSTALLQILISILEQLPYHVIDKIYRNFLYEQFWNLYRDSVFKIPKNYDDAKKKGN
jgi:hypothetical protein